MPKRSPEYAACQKLLDEHPDWTPRTLAAEAHVDALTAQNAKREWRRKHKARAKPVPERVQLDDADIFATNLESFLARYRALEKELEHTQIEKRKWCELAGRYNADMVRLMGPSK